MPVLYDNKKIIPAPFVEINKVYQKGADGTLIGSLFSLNITGKIVAFKGSPSSSGTFWTNTGYPPDEVIVDDSRMKAIIRKQEAIRQLFKNEGRWLEFQPWDGTAPVKCTPRINSITFPEGIWHTVCDYTIVAEADVLYINGSAVGEDGFNYQVSDASESWSIESGEAAESELVQQTFRLTHNVSATGKRFYNTSNVLDMEAWEQARGFVQSRLGIDNARITASGVLNLPSYYHGVNHVRGESLDKLGGSYAVTETWVVASGNATEDFTVTTTRNIDDGLTTVDIQGDIRGYDIRDSNFQITQTKYTSASGKFDTVQNQLLSRAQAYSGYTLNVTPKSESVGRNPIAGVINYNFTYDNRPSNCITGARSENITIIDNYPADVFAAIPVLGRTAGPVLQSISTVTVAQRQLTIEAIMVPSASCATLQTDLNTKPDVTSIINAAKNGLTYTQIFTDRNEESWSPKSGRYSRQISWTYQ